jgi:Arylsulfotransferase (ASST)
MVGTGLNPFDDHLTRRGFVAAAGAAFAALSPQAALAAVRMRSSASQTGARFVSRPDLVPPAVTVNAPAGGTAPGYIFLAPFPLATEAGAGQSGPMIIDERGGLVWFRPVVGRSVMNFRVQRYRGQDVLTWYEGHVSKQGSGYGGDYMIADQSYRELTRVRAGNGLQGDLHEFLITSRDTALIAIFSQIPGDATAIGGPAAAQIVEGVVQEIEIATGRVLFEWHSLEHVPVAETLRPDLAGDPNIDYFHLNSIAVDHDGDLLVSARHTSCVYKIDRQSGQVLWRLGGSSSDFSFDAGATFNFQHDARPHADGTLTVFDNAAWGPGSDEPPSHGLRLRLDLSAMHAALVTQYATPDPRLAFAMGDVQQLPNGDVFIGWGTAGSFSELGPAGDLRFDAALPAGSASYRVFRQAWNGRPETKPTAVLRADAAGAPPTVHVSWNGATEVAHWQLRVGKTPTTLRAVRTVARGGFETAIPLPGPAGYAAVAALDTRGRQLAATKPLRVA